ncbi:hypothetical protein F2P81_015898 [Scophthalmus maximus]|uniref:Uncharacterized protein n=1 Tax=Scophthalmus maximus TaxID=52904 RepID=A0A6A4SAU5_SCOMX|nr:hypothetical protein F2P81_015898 [Scophthalmus maximus]
MNHRRRGPCPGSFAPLTSANILRPMTNECPSRSAAAANISSPPLQEAVNELRARWYLLPQTLRPQSAVIDRISLICAERRKKTYMSNILYTAPGHNMASDFIKYIKFQRVDTPRRSDSSVCALQTPSMRLRRRPLDGGHETTERNGAQAMEVAAHHWITGPAKDMASPP